MKTLYAAAAALATLGAPVAAQSLRDCDTFEANARNLIFPADRNTRSYANGAIRFIALDTGGEPACCSSHFMVLSPAPEDGPGEICTLVSYRDTFGYAGVDLSGAQASYDPVTGLTVAVPVSLYRADGSGSDPATITVNVNQQTGVVTAEGGSP